MSPGQAGDGLGMSTDIRAQVLQAIDLVALIGQSVALKKRGRHYVGLCPFHQEKAPSFHVSPEKQTFYCFGCKVGGTAFDFVMKRDRVEFKEALEILARQAGITLPAYGGARQPPGERQLLLDAHTAACRFFENLFWDPHRGAAARNYMLGRGFKEETLRSFGVGLAPDSWDALLSGPVGRKFPPSLLLKAGLVKQREDGSGFYDTFRNRIIFPIRNEAGQIIAFGGRVMPGSDDPAKYLNSPETPLFAKSRSVFGLSFARESITLSRTVAVVEGYTDVMMAHQFGAANVVSVLGTAMTEHHVGLLRRFADRIVLLFDADAAGDMAVNRVVELFLTQPVEIAVASMPAGLDPDEFLLRHGKQGFEQLLAGAKDALEYGWSRFKARFAADGSVTGQQRAVGEYLDMLAQARAAGKVDALRWGAALVRVSRLTEIPLDQLNRRFASKRSAWRNRHPADAGSFPGQSGQSAPHAGEMAQRTVLGAILNEPQRLAAVRDALKVEDFQEPRLRALAGVLWEYQHSGGKPVLNELLASLSDENIRSLAVELAVEAEEIGEIDKALDDAVAYMVEARRATEEREMFSAAHEAGVDQQVEMLRRLQEKARRPDLRRIGP